MERLEEAVTAYRVALEQWPREPLSFEWSWTLFWFAGALSKLDQNGVGTARLEEAIDIYSVVLPAFVALKAYGLEKLCREDLDEARELLAKRKKLA